MARSRSGAGLLIGLSLAAGGVALVALARSSRAAAPPPGGAPTGGSAPPAQPEKPQEQPPASGDPLPDYALTQANIVSAVIAFVEEGRADYLTSVSVKALSSPLPIRAYLLATLAAVPAQLKADLRFVREFEMEEEKRAEAIAAVNSRNDSIIRATESIVVTVVTKVNAIAGAVVALGVAIGEAARSIVTKLLPIPRRSGIEQIYLIREGYGMRKGILFQPDLPYITRGEIEQSDKLRARWLSESAQSLWFAGLPDVPSKTAVRFAPRWSDYQAAVAKLEESGARL